MDAKEWPWIEVLSTPGDDSTSRRIPVAVRRDRSGNIIGPERIGEQPSEAIPQPVLLGNTEQRSVLDVSQIIWKPWLDGMGQDEYIETEGIRTFSESECETAYDGVLVCPPLATALTGTIPFAITTTARAVYLGYTDAELLVYNVGGDAAVYDPAPGGWTQITGAAGKPDNVWWCQKGLTASFLIAQSDSANQVVWRTADGVTWTNVTGTGLPATPLLQGLAFHDNKVCVLHIDVSNSQATLYTSTDAHTSAAPTWTARQSFYYEPGKEAPTQLCEWVYPPDPKEPCLWALSNRRWWYWDEFAASPKWTLFKTFRSYTNSASIASVYMHAWERNKNAYVINNVLSDYAYEYAGPNVEGIVSPNARGGLPSTAQFQMTQFDGDAHHLYAWGNIPASAPSNRGAVYKMNDQQGWHYVFRHATATVAGGCLGPDAIYTVCDDEKVYKITYRDEATLPQNAIGREYDSAARVHKTGLTDGGTPNLDKQALWVHLRTLIPSGAQVRVGYQRDTDANPTYVQTLTSADTGYVVVNIATAVLWKQIRVVLELTRGTATSATPVIYSTGLAYTRIPVARYGYIVRALVDGEASPYVEDDEGKYGKYSASALRTWLRALSGKVVGFRFGGMGRSTDPSYNNVTRAQLAMVPQESPESGEGDLVLTLFDLTQPASG